MSYSYPHISNSFSSRFLLTSMLLTGCLSSVHAVASTQGTSLSPSDFGASISALFSSRSIGYGDMMIPLVGRNQSFFYIDPQVSFHSKDDYAGSLGFGKRWLQSEQAGILGAYVFADYSHSPMGNHFWYVSPGVERLGKIVDFSANLYIPVSNQRVFNGTYYGNQLGIYDYVRFQGNSQYDQLFNSYESVGVGGDAEIGFRLPLPNNPKIYLGGYYFCPKDAQTIRGAVARLEVPVSNRLTLSLSEGYDNVTYNTVKLGITYNFGARHNSFDFKGDLTDRMLDPVQRNLVSVAGGAVVNQPIVTTNTPTGIGGEEFSDITFFNISGNPSDQDGTFEHPYIQFNQANVDAANALGNITFYVNSGVYKSDSTITLTNDSIWGRQTYNDIPFAEPAQGNNRPLFDFSGMPESNYVPSLVINQNGRDVTVDSIRLVGNPTNNTQYGLEINNTSITLVNLSVNNIDSGVFTGDLYIYNEGMMNSLSITNSSFHDTLLYGAGASITTEGPLKTITIDNSQFNNNGAGGLFIFAGINGLVNDINISDSSFENSRNFGSSGLLISTQYTATDPGTVPTILNTTINNSTFNGNYYGLQTLNMGGNIGNFTVNNSTFNNNVYGMYLYNQAYQPGSAAIMGTFTVRGTTIENNNTAGISIANGYKSNTVNATGQMGQVTISDSTISGNSTGINVQNYDTIGGITLSNVDVLDNSLGINVLNQGTIGKNNAVILDGVTFSGNGRNTQCSGARITNPDGTVVYCR